MGTPQKVYGDHKNRSGEGGRDRDPPYLRSDTNKELLRINLG